MVGLKEGLLLRKRREDNEPSKGEDPTVTSSIVLLALQRPASPILSLEMITPADSVPPSKGQGRAVVGTFWDDANCAMVRPRYAVFVEDLKPLTTRPSNELMSSHIQKIM